MSTATVDTQFERRGVEHRPGLARLTAVELRKMTDTRAGFWLLAGVVALTAVAVVLLLIVGDEADKTFENVLALAVQPRPCCCRSSASCWSLGVVAAHRDDDLPLVPHRSRVITAKLLASVVLSLAALVAAIAIAALGTAIAGPDVEGAWSLSAGMLGQIVFYIATGMITGVAFGALLLASAPTIVLYFALPLALSALGAISALEGAARWLDGSRTLAPLTDELFSGTGWARVGTTLALWMLLPLLAGLWRITRGEVR